MANVIRNAIHNINGSSMDVITDSFKNIRDIFKQFSVLSKTANPFPKFLSKNCQEFFDSSLKPATIENYNFSLNTIKFIGMIYNKGILPDKILIMSLKALLDVASRSLEPFIEYLCTLLLVSSQKLLTLPSGRDLLNLCTNQLYTLVLNSGRSWESMPNYVIYALKICSSDSVNYNNNQDEETKSNDSVKTEPKKLTVQSVSKNEKLDDFNNFIDLVQKLKAVVVVSPNSETFYSFMIPNMIDWFNSCLPQTNDGDGKDETQNIHSDCAKMICSHEMNIYRSKTQLFRKTYCLKIVDFSGNVQMKNSELNKLMEKYEIRKRAFKSVLFVADMYKKDMIEVDFLIEQMLLLQSPEIISNVSLESFAILIESTISKLMTIAVDGPIMVTDLLARVQNIVQHTACSLRIKYFMRQIIDTANRTYRMKIESSPRKIVYQVKPFPLKFCTPTHFKIF